MEGSSRSEMDVLDTESVRGTFPRPVGIGVRHAGDPGVPPLFEEEASLLSPGAVERRRLHFHLGRAAAHDALADLGCARAAIGIGTMGEPVWPKGLVGSISHAGDVAVAIVGRREDYAGIGVDVERVEAGIAGSAPQIASPGELAWTRQGARPSAETGHLRLTMLFSAKESVFKALYPIEEVWLDFLDAELEWSEEASEFVARLRRDAGADFPRGSTLTVRCRVDGERVATWTWVSPRTIPRPSPPTAESP